MPLPFRKNITELEAGASKWWPSSLAALEKHSSIVPLLLSTQEQFLSLLKLCRESPLQIFDIMEAACFPANLFLKHLVVLADFGGEQINRIGGQFKTVFPVLPSGEDGFEFSWKEKKYTYKFKTLPVKALGNAKLSIDGPTLLKPEPLTDLQRDMIMILLFASTCSNDSTAETLFKCEIGTMLGEPDILDKYIKEKYIWVSRITGGAQANTLGQIAQTYIVDYLRKELGDAYEIVRNGHIIIDGEELPFDVVVSKNGKSVGIEVSFQVTTNSTIERKATHAADLEGRLHDAGHFVAYIIDGAGNFQRSSAISKICNHSDCTVAYSDAEFETLVSFLRSVLP